MFEPSCRQHRVQGRRPLFYLVRRGPGVGTLDSALLAQVCAAGATTHKPNATISCGSTKAKRWLRPGESAGETR